jgi:C-terminal processing protease CtpA/Prc
MPIKFYLKDIQHKGRSMKSRKFLERSPSERSPLTSAFFVLLLLGILLPLPSFSQPDYGSPTENRDGETLLKDARNALRGPEKDPVRAQKLLIEIVERHRQTLNAGSLSYVYVYLGYINDRLGNRKQAISWYQQALAIPDGDAGIRGRAANGLQEPVTWIRHLDWQPGGTNPTGSPGQPLPPEKGYITTEQPPQGMVPLKTLTPQEQQANFNFLWKAIDETYAHFQLKSIDWNLVRQKYQEQLSPEMRTDMFYLLMFRMVNELKDSHSWILNYKPSFPAFGPGLNVGTFGGKPYVFAEKPASGNSPKSGSEILEIDGLTVKDKIEQLRSFVRAFSTERAFFGQTSKDLLAGEKGTTINLKLLSPNKKIETFSLNRDQTLSDFAPLPCAVTLTRQRFVHFGHHSSGFGYIRIESFSGREEIATEFGQALEALRSAPGIILDIRNNPGGYGQTAIVGRFLSTPTLCATGFRKSGPGHRDLARIRDEVLPPTGTWQYSAPVALLTNEVTGSAADLFTCYLRSAKRVVTIGSTTHGNLSGVASFAILPCGLVVRISNGYVCDASGKPVEGIGNVPDVPVAETVADYLAGKDQVLERAVSVLRAKLAGNENKGSPKLSP